MDMKKDYIPINNAPIDEFEARQYNPLVLAFVGDSVHHLIVRSRLACNTTAKTGQLHILASKEVKASTQADMIDRIIDELTDDELSVYKRARNSKMNTMAKHATCGEYKKASGFEALIGYLYLTAQHERLEHLYSVASNANSAIPSEIEDNTISESD